VSGDEPIPATVSVREAAYCLLLSPTTIRRGIRDGQIRGYVTHDRGRPSYRVDRQWLLDFANLDDYPFERIPFPPAPPPTRSDTASALALAMGRGRRKPRVRPVATGAGR
jgi:hypothetical protein